MAIVHSCVFVFSCPELVNRAVSLKASAPHSIGILLFVLSIPFKAKTIPSRFLSFFHAQFSSKHSKAQSGQWPAHNTDGHTENL